MQRFERETWVDAPLSRVWAFHSTVDGLRALTPNWFNLRVEDIDNPDPGSRNSDILTAGTTIRASVAPLHWGPRQHWTSVIEERDEGDGQCYFVDDMREGPLPEWRHTHLFYGDGDRTLVRDHVEYEAPAGPVGNAVITRGLDPAFAYRHRRTREIFAGE